MQGEDEEDKMRLFKAEMERKIKKQTIQKRKREIREQKKGTKLRKDEVSDDDSLINDHDMKFIQQEIKKDEDHSYESEEERRDVELDISGVF